MAVKDEAPQQRLYTLSQIDERGLSRESGHESLRQASGTALVAYQNFDTFRNRSATSGLAAKAKRILWEVVMKRFLTTAVAFLIPFAALAQQSEGQLSTNEAVPSLMLFTLGAGLVIAIGLLVWFLRRRSNRAAMERVIKD